jgi:hypothetical protein
MNTAYRTPLLEFFRRGEVARDVRLEAARGALAPRAHEQLALLVLLTSDPDAEIARTAEATLASIPPAPLSRFLARPDVPAELRSFFATRQPGMPMPDAPCEASGPAADPEDDLPDDDVYVLIADDALPEAGAASESGPTLVSSLPVTERIKLAMKGTREHRALLIRDPNKLVSAAVLSSPKLNDSEVEAFARMANVSEEVLRIIGTNRSWIKKYTIVASLVRNPKTPPAVSMPMVARLNEKDMKTLTTDRNVPEVLRLAARKFVAANLSRRH